VQRLKWRVRSLYAELLESRNLFASISGTVGIDGDANHRLDDHDEPVIHAAVWIDRDGNRKLDPAIDLITWTDDRGGYTFENLEPGVYDVRYQAGPGLAQTSPFQFIGWRRNADVNTMNLVTIDLVNGRLSDISPASLPNRAGLIKTIDGDYYAAGHLLNTLVRIDPISGTETLFPTSDKQWVAGLAYDPLMDELFTLAADTEDDVRKLFRIDRATAELTPVAEIAPNIAVARGTSALTFNWITRELISYNNGNSTFFSYDLQGNAKQLGRFPEPFSFYNLSFDGYRYLTYRPEGTQIKVYEVDPENATATEIIAFEGATTGNAGEILAANEPHTIVLESEQAHVGADFLAARLTLQNAVVTVDDHSLRLADLRTGLDLTYGFPASVPELEFCLGTSGFEIAVLAQSASRPLTLQLSPEDDVIQLAEPMNSVRLNAAEGRDTLKPVHPMSLDLSLEHNWESIEVLDLRHESGVTLTVDPDSVSRLSGTDRLTVELGGEDRLSLNPGDWTARPTLIVRGRRLHQLAADAALLEISNEFGWLNPLNRFDVNRDKGLTPLDALLIINVLNQTDDRTLNVGNEAHVSAEYVDVSGDGWLTPLDALLVINELNRS
jgi:hypothetical protein